MLGFFVTGTDTGVGKTLFSSALIRALRQQGRRVAPYKPVASGSEWTAQGLRNDDALKLIAAAEGEHNYELVNPYCFEPAISPHLAARQADVSIDLSVISRLGLRLIVEHDLLVAEGAGGWFAPLGDNLDVADMARALDLPVILVVGLRLGCLNHARLTAEVIESSGHFLAGWVGSQIDPDMQNVEDNIETLKRHIAAPCLGIIPPVSADDTVEKYIDLSPLCY